MLVAQALLGLGLFYALAWSLGGWNRRVLVKRVALGAALQFALALLFTQLPGLATVFRWLNRGVLALNDATTQATAFMFGYLGGGELPFEEVQQGASYIVAFRVLPLILVVSALSSLLFYWGVLPRIIGGLSFVLRRTLRISGPLGFSSAASLFLGIIEAPLVVRPYLASMSRADLLALMTCAMSTVAGTVMVLYANVLAPVLPDAMTHILMASVISIPAALTIAHLAEPGENTPDAPTDDISLERDATSSMDALMRGTQDGLTMVLQVTAAIIVLFALVHMVNGGLALLSPDETPLTLQKIFGWVFAPALWLTGMPWAEATLGGELMGTKTILNEFVAYLEFAGSGQSFSGTSRVILTYALCGFANLGSLGILVAGLDALLPDRRDELSALALKSLLTGTLTTLSTASVIGVLIHSIGI